MVSEAQKRATKKWREKNKEQARRNSYRRSARTFIRSHAQEEDLKELEELIAERRKELSDGE